jgi:hypothetical protein
VLITTGRFGGGSAGTSPRVWVDADPPARVSPQVKVRAPHVLDTIQIYHEQYRMVRGFILPLDILAVIFPFWVPVIALDGVGSIGPFPIIHSQAFLVGLLAFAVCAFTFRERAYPYSSAKALAWVTSDRIDAKDHDED